MPDHEIGLPLMERFHKGDMKAVEEIFFEYHSRFCWFAYNILDDEIMAKQVVADAFMEAVNTRERFANTADLRIFCYRHIFKNCVQALMRRKPDQLNRRQQWLIKETHQEDEESRRAELLAYKKDVAFYAEYFGILSAEINRRPKKYQAIIRNQLGGVPIEQTSQELGISTAEVSLIKKRIADDLRNMQLLPS